MLLIQQNNGMNNQKHWKHTVMRLKALCDNAADCSRVGNAARAAGNTVTVTRMSPAPLRNIQVSPLLLTSSL